MTDNNPEEVRTEFKAQSIVAYGKTVVGCMRYVADVMITFIPEGSKEIYDVFLTQGPAEVFVRDLDSVIKRNRGMTLPSSDPDVPQEKSMLKDELSTLLNRKSRENESDTPDFILAEFMLKSLEAFEAGVRARDKWFGTERWKELNGELRQNKDGG